MAYEQAFQRQLEYLRYYVDAVLTEDGVFLKDGIPADYEGSVELGIEVVYAIFFIDPAGRLVLQTYNPPDIQSIDRETGLPITLPSGETVREGEGDPIQLQERMNSHLPEPIPAKATKMLEAYKRLLGEWRL